MNTIKQFIHLSLWITLLALTGCSDDDKYSVDPLTDDATITFSISIPEPQKVVSRAENDDVAVAERAINDLSVLIYDAAGNRLQSKLDIKPKDFISGPSGDNSTTKITVTLSDDAKAYTGDADIYIIANAGDILTADNSATRKELGEITSSATLPADGGFIMSGKVTGSLTSASLLTNQVTLIRTAAKLTIENEAATSFKLSSTALYNGATKRYVTAGADDTYCDATDGNIQQFDSGNTLYTSPCKNAEGNTCLIVGGSYRGIDGSYYRLDLATKEGESMKNLDLKPNHWYEVHITSVTGPGYASADEAARHPSTMTAEIYDHHPEVLDMAFDGIRELGVTDTIVYKGNGEATVTVKYYSKAGEEMDVAPQLTSDVSWITSISGPQPAGADNSTTPGTTVKYTVNFTGDVQELGLGSLEGAITTTWQGLSRKTVVIWERAFDGHAICSSTMLTIHPTDGKGDKVINDYWTFLAGKGTVIAAAGDAPVLFGVQPDDMGGKVRNQGFHFPVMYGKKGVNGQERWSYSYEVETIIENSKYTVTAQNDLGDITFEPNTKGVYYTFTLTRPGNTKGTDGSDANNDYTYETGKLVLSLTPKEQRETSRIASTYEFDLYHTGFFHYDDNSGSHRVDADAHKSGYYYYEVLPVVGASGRTRYLLDRNLGATAAGMYIQTIDGNSHINPSAASWPFSRGKDSAGGYYYVAEQGENYSGPQMYDNVCPPGYRVPQQRMWDAIRNSPNYSSSQSSAASASYFRSQYQTTATVIRNGHSEQEVIYFPKSRYLENNSPTGDANSGYYWSATDAAGTEKEQIGRWLKSLQITGDVTTYINGDIKTFGMSVRPINDIKDNVEYEVISFNVKGATHVFLYSGEISDKNYTTTWPGHAIGNYNTADVAFFNFIYESSVYKPANLKAIFNYVDEAGKIHTISKNGNVPLSEAKGWEVSELLNKNVTCKYSNPNNLTIE